MRMPYLDFHFGGRGWCKVPQRDWRSLEGKRAINTAYDYGGKFCFLFEMVLKVKIEIKSKSNLKDV